MKNVLIILFIFSVFESCYVISAHRFRKFNLKDLHKIDAVPLPAAATPFRFQYDTTRYPKWKKNLDSILPSTHTYAFLVIRRDSILYERYFDGVESSTLLPSFSIAKSFTATLVGIALNEGKIKSLQEPVTAYLPGLGKRNPRFEQITIQHLLDMRSGVKSSEDYDDPFSDVLKLSFASNMTRQALKTGIQKDPGSFEYKSVNTQLLALILEKATGKKLEEYANEKLWQPLQMEHSATWNMDKKDEVRAFCCINATARDFARFGRLYLRQGDWQGQQVLPRDWVQRSTSADTMAAYTGYKNHWWARTLGKAFPDSMAAVKFNPTTGTKASIKKYSGKEGQPANYVASYWSGAYHAEGILNQILYIDPVKELIIVRLGHYWQHPQGDAVRFVYNLASQF